MLRPTQLNSQIVIVVVSCGILRSQETLNMIKSAIALNVESSTVEVCDLHREVNGHQL